MSLAAWPSGDLGEFSCLPDSTLVGTGRVICPPVPGSVRLDWRLPAAFTAAALAAAILTSMRAADGHQPVDRPPAEAPAVGTSAGDDSGRGVARRP